MNNQPKSAKKELKLISPGEIRVRLAPAPTGFLHLGTARTALFNYLFAKKEQGSFILRLEDTDIERSEKKWGKDILEGLKWLGIVCDEGPDCGGNFGPYRQSERKEIYKKYMQKLLAEEKIYFCFCSQKDLEAHRQYLMSQGKPPRYSGKCRGLSAQEVQNRLNQGQPYILRFKTPAKKVAFEDILRGKIEYNTDAFGDIVVAKGLREPLYNLACVIDDFEMKISHVIRGEDHIPNTPKQILIAEALSIESPHYLHLPLILGQDRTKLSKRHGAKPLLHYKKEGYLPEAMVNFLALLGWNPGTEREIFSMSSLVQEFSLDKIQKAGAVFNPKKLDWLNGFYIRQKSLDKLTQVCIPYLVEKELIVPLWEKKEIVPLVYEAPFLAVRAFELASTKEKINFDELKKIVGLYQERLKKLSEIPELIDFFFKTEMDYSGELLQWKEMTTKEIKDALDKLKKCLSHIKEADWARENLERILLKEAEKFAITEQEKIEIPSVRVGEREKITATTEAKDRGYLLWPLRVALTGKKASASPFAIAELLGKEKTLERIKQARKKL